MRCALIGAIVDETISLWWRRDKEQEIEDDEGCAQLPKKADDGPSVRASELAHEPRFVPRATK